MTALPGLTGYYQYQWDSSSSVTSPGVYVMEYRSDNLLLDMDVYTFTEPADLEAKKFLYNQRTIDKTASPYPIETLYDVDGTTILGQWELYHSIETDSRIPL
jgi:hypothetical protein